MRMSPAGAPGRHVRRSVFEATETTMTRPGFRAGFYAGLIVAVAAGAYLFQRWQPDRQVALHSVQLLHAIEHKDWREIADFIDPAYHDQWQHDRAVLLARMHAILQYTRKIGFDVDEPLVVATDKGLEWRGRIVVSGEDDDLTALIKARINPLHEPFRLDWRRQSWKPWDWKLLRVSNEALELPEAAGF